MSTLALTDVLNVSVYLTPGVAAQTKFNIGCIIGPSTIINPTTRVKKYTSLAGMIADGFTSGMPEYVAASLYFSQTPTPTSLIVGVINVAGAETKQAAFTACRNASSEWYAGYVCGAVKADILAIAGDVEVMTPFTSFFYTTADADALAGTTGNVFDTLKGLNYRRSIGMYSTQTDAAAGLLGVAMGGYTGFANSAYTLNLKTIVGVTTESVTETQYGNITGKNGNVYVNRASTYNLFQTGAVANGSFYDEVINLDQLVINLQVAGMGALISVPKIPQTESGMTYLINALKAPLEDAVNTGFLAPGKWTGPVIGLASAPYLSTGDTLTSGYAIYADPISSQSDADRQARKAPPIYIAVKEAGAIHSVTIGVYVNR